MFFSLALLLASSLAWSGLDWSRKAIAHHITPLAFLIVLTAGQALLLLPTLLGAPVAASPAYWLPALASVALNLAANWLFMRAVAISPFSLTIPYLALTPMFTTLIAVFMLGEVPGAAQALGIGLTVAGALALNPAGSAGPWGMLRGVWQERGSAYMVGVAALWSLTASLDKLAMAHASPTFHGLVLSAGLPLAFLAILAFQGRLGELSTVARRPGVMVLAIGFGTAGLVLQLMAMQAIYVGVVEAVKRVIGLGMAALVGRLFFKEPVTWPKLVALAVMALGVALILVPVP